MDWMENIWRCLLKSPACHCKVCNEKSDFSLNSHISYQILWRSNDISYAETWNYDKGFLRKHLRRCWDIRSTRSSEAWVTSLVITYTKSIWKMVMHGDGEKQDFTQYFHASENNPKKWEICTVQQQMCIVQVPYQCFCWCFKRHKTLIIEEKHAHARFARNIPNCLRVDHVEETKEKHT